MNWLVPFLLFIGLPWLVHGKRGFRANPTTLSAIRALAQKHEGKVVRIAPWGKPYGVGEHGPLIEWFATVRFRNMRDRWAFEKDVRETLKTEPRSQGHEHETDVDVVGYVHGGFE